MNRSNRFFTTNKKGEVYELKNELNSEYRHVRNDAIKKVIASMTIGKDVSGLFPDVLKNMQTEDIELKKLVYLYLINYAKTQPELAILAVNTFVKDSDDPNPLIRALAIRTMGCIHVEKILDYLMEPLRRCLRDENPYVRKTAALCVAKLYEMEPELTKEQGFLVTLREMIADVNPMVVANVVIALEDIDNETRTFFKVEETTVNTLLHALNECNEWGQVSILSALSEYKAKDEKEADSICNRVIPRLQHVNGAVVLSAVKVILINLPLIRDENVVKMFCKKLAPPLVTLLSSPPEFQYIALRNISLVLQKYSQVLSNEIRVFFCKYNDPPYVKLEKLEILIRLCNDRNVDQLLSELKEYANEVDVEFVRKSVNAIGRCAIKIPEATERCINVLLDLINTGVSYIVQEAIVIIKDVFRKYPRMYEGIIPQLCENVEALDEPNAKSSLIWIIGEYAEKIDNADDLISFFLENFTEENAQVQLQLLTATVKLFLKKPNENQSLVQSVLMTASTECDNADIRDRAYIYWRLLSTDPQAAKAVILSEKPPVEGETKELSPALLDTLISEIGSLASIYHKPSETFIAGKTYGADNVRRSAQDLDIEDDATAPPERIREAIKNNDIGNLLDLDWSEPAPANENVKSPSIDATSNPLDDLLSLSSTPVTSSGSIPNMTNTMTNTMSNTMSSTMSTMMSPTMTSMISPTTPQKTQTNDDMLDFFGSTNSSSPSTNTTTPASNTNNTKNDPFADLL